MSGIDRDGTEREKRAAREAFDVERLGEILTVTLTQGTANVIDASTSRELSAIFEEFRDDAGLRVAIVTGRGDRFFSAGWDLNAANEGEHYRVDNGPGGFGGFPELPGLRKPVIVAVNGLAAGGGFEMVLAADLVIAVDHARFLLPEALRGITPDVGLVALHRRLPKPLATEMLLGTRQLTAAEALHHGLVNRVVASHELMDAAHDLARDVIAAAPLSVAAILDVVEKTETMTTSEALAWLRSGAATDFERALDSADAREGIAAFVEKRPPEWTGT